MNSVIRNTSTGNIVKQDDNDGVLMGAHVGYNWQWDQMVIGIEGDLSNTGWSQSDNGPGDICAGDEPLRPSNASDQA